MRRWPTCPHAAPTPTAKSPTREIKLQIFTGMGAPAAVVEQAIPYLRARCLASPAILMCYALSGVFRGEGGHGGPAAKGARSM